MHALTHFAARLAALAGASLALSAAAGGDEPQPALPAPSAPALAEVLVTGEQPGPGMWRVSSGKHELWIWARSIRCRRG